MILGQTFVALNFAELSSHFPVAGSIYQWSKRLSNRTLGWFTGWIYFWAGVITVTAVAATVPLVMSTIWPRPDQARRSRRRSAASTCSRSSASWSLVTTTLINIGGVRLLAIINNIGVGAEILGMLVFATILLFFANHQSPSVLLDTSYTSGLADGNYFAVFLVGCVHGRVRRLRVRHRRHLRRGDHRREPAGAARACCPRSGCRASSARSSCSR